MIELTLKNGKRVLVNLNKVTDISENNDGTACVTYSENYYFGVTESYEEVRKILVELDVEIFNLRNLADG